MLSTDRVRPEGTTPSGAADEDAVRGLYHEFMDAWNRASGEALADVFTPDGDLVAFDGTHLRGRQQIGPIHEELFATFLKGTRLVGVVQDVRFLSPEVAVMHAVGGTIMRGQSEPAPDRDSIQTLVASRSANGWRVAAFQNTRVRPISRNAAAFLVWSLSDWLWKVFRLSDKRAYDARSS